MAREWEERLRSEGMPDELGEDAGKKALEERSAEEGAGAPDEAAIAHALQKYWVFRNPAAHGEHLQIAQSIAADLGVRAEDIPQDMVDAVGREVVQAEKKVQDIVFSLLSKNEALRFNERRLGNMARRAAQEEIGGMDPDAMDGIVERAVNSALGYR